MIRSIVILSLLASATAFADAATSNVRITGERIMHSPAYYSSTEGRFVLQLRESTSDARVFVHTGLGGTCYGNERYNWQYIEDFELSRDCSHGACGPWTVDFSKTLHHRGMPCQFESLQFVFRVDSVRGTYYIRGGNGAAGYFEARLPGGQGPQALSVTAVDKNQ